MNKEPNIYSFADECYVYYGDYKKDLEEKDKEIERLKAREQECIDRYLAESKYRGEVEGKYVLAKYVIDELEKWLSNEYMSGNYEEYYRMGLKDSYNKLKELKEGK